MSYNYFVAVDASKAFVTGDGEDVSDDISGLDDEGLEALAHWSEFYQARAPMHTRAHAHAHAHAHVHKHHEHAHVRVVVPRCIVVAGAAQC